jgi:hypothetical protein
MQAVARYPVDVSPALCLSCHLNMCCFSGAGRPTVIRACYSCGLYFYGGRPIPQCRLKACHLLFLQRFTSSLTHL